MHLRILIAVTAIAGFLLSCNSKIKRSAERAEATMGDVNITNIPANSERLQNEEIKQVKQDAPVQQTQNNHLQSPPPVPVHK